MSNKRIVRTPAPVAMWAAVSMGSRSNWIHIETIKRTRREARAAWLGYFEPEYREKAMQNIRFTRVVVSEAPNE